MFDPFSALGAIGTTAGLLGFLCSTIRNLDATGEDFREYSSRLQHRKFELQSCEKLLSDWVNSWCRDEYGEPYPDQAYRCFWGSPGYEQICDRLDSICKEVEEIRALLSQGPCRGETAEHKATSYQPSDHFRTPPNKSEWREFWSHHVSALSKELSELRTDTSRTRSTPPASLTKRVGFAIYRSRRFKDRVKSLRRLTQHLKEYSQFLFWYTQDDKAGTISREVMPNMLWHRNDVRVELEKLSVFMNRLHQALDGKLDHWNLLLRVPDQKGRPDSLNRRAEIALDYIVGEPHSLNPGSARYLVRVSTHNSSTISIPSVGQLNRTYIQGEPSSAEPINVRQSLTLKEELVGISSPQIDQRLLEWTEGQHSTLYRAQTAVGLVNWTILLWNSPWTSALCTCRLRLLSTSDQDVYPILQTVPIHMTSCTLKRTSTRSYRSELEANLFTKDNRRLLLLGLSLAELATLQPMRVTDASDLQPRFRLPDGSLIDLAQLLSDVRQKSNSYEYEEAVRACFSFDRIALTRPLLPQDVDRYSLKILQP